MNINDDLHYDSNRPDGECDELLDHYFDSVEQPMVDTEGIAILTRIKMLRERIRSRRAWAWRVSIGAVAACAVVLLALNLFLGSTGVSSEAGEGMLAGNEIPESTYNEVTVPTGQRMTLMLADGTQLIANSRSQVRYPSRFDGDVRHVWVKGEVYFDVAKDEARPFIVSADGFDVRVLGTKFCVSSYSPAEASVTLVQGSVALTTDTDERIRMRPNQRVNISDGTIDEISIVDTSLFTSWTRGGLLLENQTLGNIVDKLNTYYGISIEVNPRLTGRKLYGSLDLKSDINGVFTVLCSIIPMEVEAMPDSVTYRISPR